MFSNKLSFFADRARDEQMRAKLADSTCAKDIHQTMAQAYSLKAMQCVLDEVRAHTPCKD
jgi:phage gp46-like protein